MNAMTRRDFLKFAGLGSSALAATLLMAGCAADSAGSTVSTGSTGSTGSSGSSGGNTVADAQAETQAGFEALEESGITPWKTMTPDPSRPVSTPSNRAAYVCEVNTGAPTSLGPFSTQMQRMYPLMFTVYEFLLVRVGVDEFEPSLAKSYHYEDDTHIIFEIFDYIKDTDGNPVTADDVVFSYNSFVESGYASDFGFYDSIEAVDEKTVRVTLKRPLDSLTAFAVMFSGVQVVSQVAYEAHNNMTTDPVGTGPYIVDAYTVESNVNLVVNEDYWQTDESQWSHLTGQNVDVIHWDYVGDTTMRTLAFVEGKNYFCELATTDLDDFMEGGKYYDIGDLHTNMGTRVLDLLPNCSEDNIMSDINMRLALWYAIDSTGIQTAQGARTNMVAVVPSSVGTSDYQDEWNSIESYHTIYDPALAKDYLQKANYNNETIRVIYNGGQAKNKIVSQVVQGFWQAIGVSVELLPYDNAILSDYVKDASCWDIYLYTAGDGVYTIARLLKAYGKAYGLVEDKTISYIEDEELENLLNTTATKDGYSIEKTTQALQLIIDRAYGYATTYVMDISAVHKSFAEVRFNYGESSRIYGACKYYLDV